MSVARPFILGLGRRGVEARRNEPLLAHPCLEQLELGAEGEADRHRLVAGGGLPERLAPVVGAGPITEGASGGTLWDGAATFSATHFHLVNTPSTLRT